MNTASMNNLWNYLQGLPLTPSNRKWLAQRLGSPASTPTDTGQNIKEELTEAFRQLEEVKEGKRSTRNAEELLYEL
ncbi:MAG: hypothetical protein IJV06_11280 [Bacteroidaceae bacterium]|nr:hypothetical protein [Bacteroidaceae bacterium]